MELKLWLARFFLFKVGFHGIESFRQAKNLRLIPLVLPSWLLPDHPLIIPWGIVCSHPTALVPLFSQVLEVRLAVFVVMSCSRDRAKVRLLMLDALVVSCRDIVGDVTQRFSLVDVLLGERLLGFVVRLQVISSCSFMTALRLPM